MTQQAGVKIPADIDRDDRLVANLTARQLAILAVTAVGLYGAWAATRALVPLPLFLAIALPVGVVAASVALGQRDGVSLDRLLMAALRHQLAPSRCVDAPEGIPEPPAWITRHANTGSAQDRRVAAVPWELPATSVGDTGVIDLGTDGIAAVATCSPVNFALRTLDEQESLVAAFGRYLHSLTTPAQILVRVERLDLSEQIAQIRENAPAMPHPSLEQAARSHADFLAELSRSADLLHRQALLILREPASAANPSRGVGVASRRARRTSVDTDAQRRAADGRLARRLTEAAGMLAPAGITVTPLDTAQATAVLNAACNPDNVIRPSAQLAGPDEIITIESTTGTSLVPDGASPKDETETDADPRISEFRRRYSP